MNEIISFFVSPFVFPFMQKALFMAVLTGAICSVLSCFLVLKGWSLMGDAISHAILVGLVLATALGLPLALGAFVAGLFCATATGYIKQNSRIKEDTVMGIVFSGMFALGMVLFLKIDTDKHLTHILFGDVLGITTFDFWQSTIIALLVLVVMLIKYKDFMLYCFDPGQAIVIGLPVKLLHYSLLTLLSLTIVSSLQAVGIILVVAMLIAPGVIAFIFARSFKHMLLISAIISILSSIVGTILSFHLDAATGPCIVIIQACFFIPAVIYSKMQMQLKVAKAKANARLLKP